MILKALGIIQIASTLRLNVCFWTQKRTFDEKL